VPELPEVETVRLTLAPLLGRQIERVWTSGKALRLGRPTDAARLRDAAQGATVQDVRRRGKYLLIDFRRRTDSVLVHLGMSGRLRLVAAAEPHAKHTHVVFGLRGSDRRELRFSDPRRFGQFEVALDHGVDHPSLRKLGPDPLLEGIDGAALYERLHRSKRPIKTAILDQELIAGVGNIYASEALFAAGIHPSTSSHRLSLARTETLAQCIAEVMRRALSHGGTSLRDFVNADGHQGDNADYLEVYDREGSSCPRRGCAGTIRRRVHQGRATFYCPSCQTR